MKPIDMRLYESELKPETNQMLFFSCFKYDELIPVFPMPGNEEWTFQKIKDTHADVLLVAGIVSPEPILQQLKSSLLIKKIGLVKNIRKIL